MVGGRMVRVRVKRSRLDRLWRLVSNQLLGTEFSETKVVRGRLLDSPPPRGRSSPAGGSSSGGSNGRSGVPDPDNLGMIRWS